MNESEEKRKYKIVALFGKAGAGKDFLQKELCLDDRDCHKVISATTRPPRQHEQHEVDYYFLSDEMFACKIMNESMLEATSFRGWFYGTPIESLEMDKINVGVFNVSGIECLLADDRLEVFPIYIKASDKQRMLRQLNREDNPDCEEICRRFQADEKDFLTIPFSYSSLLNEKNDGFFATIDLRHMIKSHDWSN